MKNQKMTEYVWVRVSSDLKQSIEAESKRLGLTKPDVVRMALALMLRGKNPRELYEEMGEKVG